jgi:hypothetical protein
MAYCGTALPFLFYLVYTYIPCLLPLSAIVFVLVVIVVCVLGHTVFLCKGILTTGEM